MTTKFVLNTGEELTHAQMTQQLMQRVTQLEENKSLLLSSMNNLVERLHYLESNI